MQRRTFLGSGVLAGSKLAMGQGAPGAGYAERDISPDIGMEQPGGYGKSYHRSFHDPCKARAAVFGDGSNRIALVGVDAGMIPRYVVRQCKERIAAQCGIPPDSVLIGASHSHSGGPIGGVEPGEYDHASAFVQKLAYEHTTLDDPVYTARVRDGIVSAVAAAGEERVALLHGAGAGEVHGVAFNRRFRMRNGQTWTHPGQGNPDVIEPAGPVDPTVSVIGSWDARGQLAGCVVNYCCHATTNPGGMSANWIYYLEQAIRGAFGHQAVVVFLQGAAGDVTQVDNRSAFQPATGEAQAKLVGGSVGGEAVKILLSMARGSLTPVRAASRAIHISRRVPSPAKVARALEIVRRDPQDVGLTSWTFAKETVLLDAKIKREPAPELELQAVQVGPVALLSSPAELFAEFGLRMRRESAFPVTMPVAYANGYAGYVPTEESLGPHGGGYETRLTSYTNLIPAAGTRIVEECLALVHPFRPGSIPEPPRAPKFQSNPSGAWSYGNVPPERE